MDSTKAVLRRKFIVIKTYLRKQEKSQMKNLTLHLNQLEKEKQAKHKISRRKEIIKIRAEIKEIKTKKATKKINVTNSWFFEKISKIDKPLARIIKKKERGLKSIKLRMRNKKLQLTPQKHKGT